jgi:hypothetical protein
MQPQLDLTSFSSELNGAYARIQTDPSINWVLLGFKDLHLSILQVLGTGLGMDMALRKRISEQSIAYIICRLNEPSSGRARIVLLSSCNTNNGNMMGLLARQLPLIRSMFKVFFRLSLACLILRV